MQLKNCSNFQGSHFEYNRHELNLEVETMFKIDKKSNKKLVQCHE